MLSSVFCSRISCGWMRMSKRREMLESEQRRNRTLIGTALGFGSLLWFGFELAPGPVGWLLLIVAAVVLWSARRR